MFTCLATIRTHIRANLVAPTSWKPL